MSTITDKKLNAKHLRFRQVGSGPVILLIGGTTKSWGETIPFLSNYFTLIIPSFSEEILHKQEDKDMVQYLTLIVKELQLEKFSILAHSLGTFTAVLFTHKYPSLVNSLILCNVPDLELGDRDKFGKLINELSGKRKPESQINQDFWFNVINNQLTNLKIEILEDHTELKTLLLWGENDKLAAYGKYHNWKEYLQSRLNVKVFRHSGHFPMKENPLYFSLVVKDFLSSIRDKTH